MADKILEDKENFLLNRREIKFIVKAGKNPSFQEAESLIANEFKAEKENIAIKGIKGKFGRDTFLITAFIYKSLQDKEKLEKKKEKKVEAGQEQPQGQTPTVQEKPKEEKK